MLRNCLAGAAGALLLSLAPLSAQSSGDGGTSHDCIVGRARGGWDLPARGELGHARGLLVERDGLRLALDARLAPIPLPGDLRGGLVDGLLFPVTDAGVGPRPIAEVHGTYLVGPDGNGRFETAIVELSSPAGDRPDVLGKLEGIFSDPMRDGRDPVGRFLGRWILCR
jgi:hypothetical protein